MGIFDALTTSVAGLQAQSYALQNISGNIANSQTTAFKRTDTSFEDLVASSSQSASRQTAGSVIAMSRSTNSLQGPVSSSSVSTHMAISGAGYFKVQAKTGESDGNAVLSGVDVYTRRGDYALNKEGYLVNGAGYYLSGYQLDSATGNPVGDTASVIKVSTGMLAAKETAKVTYEANLPSNPSVGTLKTADFQINPTNLPAAGAKLTADSTYTPIDTSAGGSLSFAVTYDDGSGAAATTTTINLDSSVDTDSSGKVSLTEAVAAINAQLATAGVTGVTASSTNGKLVLSGAAANAQSSLKVDTIATTGTGPATSDLGFNVAGQTANGRGVGQNYVAAKDNDTFQKESINGGSTTAYAADGTALSVQLRWARVSESPDTWNLFYKSDSSAVGSTPMWTNSGQSFVFTSGGKLDTTQTPASAITLTNMTLNGTNLGNISFDYSAGLTQFSTSQGTASISDIKQDGRAAGTLVSLGVSADGRVSATYSNGEQIDIASVPLYTFKGESDLKKLDGGAFAATKESGDSVESTQGKITGQALEGSNTDIADEFSKMIVTQQAYAANSKVITTADNMMQSVLSIIR